MKHPYTLIVLGKDLTTGRETTAILHVWSMGCLHLGPEIQDIVEAKTQLQGSWPIALFEGHHYDVLPDSYSEDATLPSSKPTQKYFLQN